MYLEGEREKVERRGAWKNCSRNPQFQEQVRLHGSEQQATDMLPK
jgi:hypothetical protein